MARERSAGILVFIDTIINNELKHQYLLLKTDKGRWDFPKGQQEVNETDIQTAKREVREETGLSIDLIPGFEHTFSYIFRSNNKELIYKDVKLFLGKSNTDKVVLSHEHVDYKWFLLKDALEVASYVNTKKLLIEADHFIDAINLKK